MEMHRTYTEAVQMLSRTGSPMTAYLLLGALAVQLGLRPRLISLCLQGIDAAGWDITMFRCVCHLALMQRCTPGHGAMLSPPAEAAPAPADGPLTAASSAPALARFQASSSSLAARCAASSSRRSRSSWPCSSAHAQWKRCPAHG